MTLLSVMTAKGFGKGDAVYLNSGERLLQQGQRLELKHDYVKEMRRVFQEMCALSNITLFASADNLHNLAWMRSCEK